MDNFGFMSFFSEEDKEFNREMVRRSYEQGSVLGNPEDRGGKMEMGNLIENKMFQDRQYDFTSEILDGYREKWSIVE